MKCKDCGRNLDNLPEMTSGERMPCPRCGSKARIFEVSITEEIKLTGHVALSAEREGKKIGFRESVRDGRSTAADKNDDGTFSHSMVGSSPQGEEDTLSVCRILVQAINKSVANWTDPIQGQGVVDCESTESTTNQRMDIQVTKAITDKAFWKQVNKSQGFNNRQVTIDILVDYLKDAIEKKGGDRNIPPDIRKGITLALDATRLPVFELDGVIEEFKNKYGQWSEKLGFHSIWLVGPQPDLVGRLDEK